MLWGPSLKVHSCSADQEIICFYGIQMFVTMSTKASHCTLFWTRWIHLHPHTQSTRSILILTSHLPNGLFSCFTTLHCIALYFSSPHAYYMSYPYHPPSFHHFNNISWRLQIMKRRIM